MKNRLRQAKSRFDQRWQTLKPREQRIVLAGTLFLGLIVFWFLVVSPWMTAQQKLRRDLPKLRADLAQMRALGKSASAIKEIRITSNATELANELRKKLLPFNLPPESIKIQVDAKGLIHLSLSRIDFNQWLNWLETVQKEHRLRLVSTQIVKTADSGIVSANLTLAIPASGKDE